MPVAFLTTVVLARRLPPDDVGTYSVLITFATVGTLFSQLGWPSATIYRIRRAGTPLAVAAGAGFWGMSALSALAVGVCLLFEDAITGRFLHGAPSEIFRLALPMLPAMIFGTWLVGVCRALERFDLNNLYRVLTIGGIFGAMGVVLLGLDGSLRQVVASVTAVHCVSSLLLGAIVFSKTGLRLAPPIAEFGASLRYGIKTYAQAIATRLHEQIDIFLLAALLAAPDEVAFFAIAVGIVNRIKMIPNSVAAAFFPHASGLPAEEASAFTATATRNAAVWVVIMTGGLALVAPVLIPLIFGQEYGASVPPLLILLPAMMFMTMATILTRFFMAFDRQGITVSVQSISAAGNVLLNLLLIPRFGIQGAALASFCSYLFAAVVMALVFRHQTGVGLVTLLVPKRSDVDFYRKRIAGLRARLST